MMKDGRAPIGADRPVEHPAQHTGQGGGDNRQRYRFRRSETGQRDGLAGDHGGKGHHRADRKINAADQDHEGHADGQDQVDGDLGQDVGDVVRRQEVLGEDGKEQDQRQQSQADAGIVQHRAHGELGDRRCGVLESVGRHLRVSRGLGTSARKPASGCFLRKSRGVSSSPWIRCSARTRMRSASVISSGISEDTTSSATRRPWRGPSGSRRSRPWRRRRHPGSARPGAAPSVRAPATWPAPPSAGCRRTGSRPRRRSCRI